MPARDPRPQSRSNLLRNPEAREALIDLLRRIPVPEVELDLTPDPELPDDYYDDV